MRTTLKTSAALVAVWMVVFAVYRLTDRPLRIIDVQAVIRLPISLWHEGDLDLDELTGIPPHRGVAIQHRGRSVSAFPFWPSLQLLPVYAAYGLAGQFPTEDTVWDAQRRAAQASMALTAVLVALLVARRHGQRIALLATVAFAFGTVNWFVLSQLAFSNGLVQLWVALALVIGLWRLPPSPIAATLSMVALVVATFFRLNMAVFAAAWAIYLALTLRRRSVLPLVAAAALATAMAAVNHAYMGHPLGLYGQQAGVVGMLSPSFGTAIYGNLLSPARGLLVFSPWLVLVGLGLVGREAEDRVAAWTVLAGSVAHYLVTCNYPRWHGGGSMGPRLTADLLPALTFLAAGGLAWSLRRRWSAVAAVAAIAAGCVIAGGHAFSDSHRWEHTPVTADVAPDRLFDWRDALVFEPFRSSPYEERYPIRLLEPGPETAVTSAVVPLRWDLGNLAAASCAVDVSFRHLPRGVRVGLVSLPTESGDSLDLARNVLPRSFDPHQAVAWRVRALDESGRTRTQSGWRTFWWRGRSGQASGQPRESHESRAD